MGVTRANRQAQASVLNGRVAGHEKQGSRTAAIDRNKKEVILSCIPTHTQAGSELGGMPGVEELQAMGVSELVEEPNPPTLKVMVLQQAAGISTKEVGTQVFLGVELLTFPKKTLEQITVLDVDFS